MRLARSVLVVLSLLLALAPAASAHDEADPSHRDTPADLAAADINRTLAGAHLARTLSPDLPQYLPTTWCGNADPTSNDTAHAAFPATQRQIKVVYAHAFDEPNDFALWKDSLQSDVSRIEQFLALQTGGRRALRFDMGTECGPQYVDVQVVHLPSNRSAYVSGTDTQNFYAVAGGVQAAVGHDTRDVFVLADGLTDPDPSGQSDGVWGIAELPGDDRAGAGNVANQGGRMGMMLTPPGTTPSAWDWQPTVMLHEITHNLGGVQRSAVHSTPNGHCWDGRDVMCYPDASSGSQPYTTSICSFVGGAIPQIYDCGHDDYFNPDPAADSYLATHWNVYTSAFMGSCAQLGMACGDNIVPTVPVNTSLPAVLGATEPGAIITASAGTWLNNPTTYALQWQRAVGSDWASVPGATGASYALTTADAGTALRVLVTATNADGSAIAASAPTAPVVGPAPPVTPKPPMPVSLRIALRDHARHAKGTLAATVVAVPAGREVRTRAAKITVTAGTWRLRLCAGPKHGSLRCALTKRVRTRTRSVRLPATRVLVRSAKGALRVTAALVDQRQRVRAQGSATST
ncbi:MAG: hypothetical protein ACXWZZ_00640 [Solirubrobacteraceae bacterium]